jgi:hypothetical protein
MNDILYRSIYEGLEGQIRKMTTASIPENPTYSSKDSEFQGIARIVVCISQLKHVFNQSLGMRGGQSKLPRLLPINPPSMPPNAPTIIPPA